MTARLLLMVLAGWTVVLLALLVVMTRLLAWAQDDDAPREPRATWEGHAGLSPSVRIPEPRSGARDVAARSEAGTPPTA